ncbi:MAG: Thiol-disulfide oxidoreductase ResA [bacterium]|nr:Thiol-disulfide oxidoreductase ResA [bacterium]
MRHPWLLIALSTLLLTTAVSAEENPERVNLTEGMTFPTFQGDTWTGEAFDFGAHLQQGKHILVDFWAAWCGPCMEEMPNVVKVMNEHQNERFEIITISLDNEQTRDRLAKVVEDYQLTFPIITDWQRWQSRYVTEYGVYGIPANFLLAPDGTILMRDLRGEDLVEITGRIANDPNFQYAPIRISMSAFETLARPTPEEPELTPAPLDLVLEVDNPQIPTGALKVGVRVTSYVDTGDVTLFRMPDGTYRKDSKTGEVLEFAVAETVVQEHFMEVSDANGRLTGTMRIALPEGTMDAMITPFTWSPVLERNIEGKSLYPSYSLRYWLDEEPLERQGGRIDPAAAIEEADSEVP